MWGMVDDRLRDFEARIAALKQKMEGGLVDRATELRALADRLDAGDTSARAALKRAGHSLRGIAGSYGHHGLGERAADLEQRASVSPAELVGEIARNLAELAEQASAGGVPPEELPSAPPARPAGVTAREQMISDRPEIASEGGQRLRVLAIDDEPLIQRLLDVTLNEVGGFEATIVGSAAEALEHLRSTRFDLIISDAMMPDMNGREFCDHARALGALGPIVILSAAAEDELGWASQVQGPLTWLRKPFRPTALVHELASIVEKTR